MEKGIEKIGVTILCIMMCVVPIQAETLTLNTLIEQASHYDGEDVIVEGEVIGECIGNGDRVWVNINDGTNALGIYMDRTQTEKITRWGNYKEKGDWVSVRGVFHEAYNSQGGDMAIEGERLEVVKLGGVISHPIAFSKILGLVLLVPLATVMTIVNYRRGKEA